MTTLNVEKFGHEEFAKNDDDNFIISSDISEFICPWFSPIEKDKLYKEIAHEFVLKKLSAIPEISYLYRHQSDFLVDLFTDIFANPKIPVRQGRVAKYEISGRILAVFMDDLVANGYFVLLMGNTEAGQQAHSKYWYPTINQKIKGELIKSVIQKKKDEINRLEKCDFMAYS